MGVKFVTKEKAVAKVVAKLKPKSDFDAETAQIVERLAAINKEIDAYKKLDAEYKQLREKLMFRFPDSTTTGMPVEFIGETHKVVFTPCSVERKIVDKPGLIEKLTPEVFIKVAEVKLGDVDKYLTLEEQAGVITASQTGPRKMSIKEI
jgi:hypothetical protein